MFSDDVTPLTPGGIVFTATLAGTLNGVNVDGIVIDAPGGAADPAGLFFDTATTNVAGNQVGHLYSVAAGVGGANFAGAVNVRITATDAGGLSVQDTMTINVLPQNDGKATFNITDANGAPITEGDTLSVTLATPDPDGGPATGFAYQWLRDGNAITGATSSSYTLSATDGGLPGETHNISVQATYNDAQGFHEVVTTAGGTIVRADNGDAPLTITGNLVEGQTIRAVLGADPDGGNATTPAPTFTWVLDDGLGNGAASLTTVGTGATHLLTAADSAPGAFLTVTATYTDKQGNAESVSQVTNPVAPTDDATMSSVTIAGLPVSGIPTIGTTLSAVLSNDDPDGPTIGVPSFQWQRGGVDIAGATGLNYKVTAADAGAAISVVANYTDGQHFHDTVTSAATAAVATNVAPVLTAIAPVSVAENTLAALTVARHRCRRRSADGDAGRTRRRLLQHRGGRCSRHLRLELQGGAELRGAGTPEQSVHPRHHRQ